jgi:hypothetical protein
VLQGGSINYKSTDGSLKFTVGTGPDGQPTVDGEYVNKRDDQLFSISGMTGAAPIMWDDVINFASPDGSVKSEITENADEEPVVELKAVIPAYGGFFNNNRDDLTSYVAYPTKNMTVAAGPVLTVTQSGVYKVDFGGQSYSNTDNAVQAIYLHVGDVIYTAGGVGGALNSSEEDVAPQGALILTIEAGTNLSLTFGTNYRGLTADSNAMVAYLTAVKLDDAPTVT